MSTVWRQSNYYFGGLFFSKTLISYLFLHNWDGKASAVLVLFINYSPKKFVLVMGLVMLLVEGSVWHSNNLENKVK